MKKSILIVDDSDSKLKMITAELLSYGVSQDDIITSPHVADARHKLQNKHFDLMLLDVVIPARADTKESSENSIELLRQIIDDELIPAPSFIVGITSDALASSASDQEFRRMTTQILYIDPASSTWRASLKQLIARVNSPGAINYDVDVCFVSALRVPEFSEVYKLPCEWSEEHILENGMLYRRGRKLIAGIERKFVCICCPQMGLVSATLTARIAIENFRPRLMLMTGICGGITGKVSLGDVIVAEKSWDWQSGKWLDDSTFEIAPDPKDGAIDLISLALKSGSKLVEFFNDFSGARPSKPPALVLGPIVSGSAVVANPAMHEHFINQHRKTLGIDMECYAIYFAAHMSPNPKPKVLCIKAVSDLANRDKSDDYQEYCSFITARLAFEVSLNYFTRN